MNGYTIRVLLLLGCTTCICLFSTKATAASASTRRRNELASIGTSQDKLRFLQQWFGSTTSSNSTPRASNFTTPISSPNTVSRPTATVPTRPILKVSTARPSSTLINPVIFSRPTRQTNSTTAPSDVPTSATTIQTSSPSLRPRTSRPIERPTRKPSDVPSTVPSLSPTSDFPSMVPTPLEIFGEEGIGNSTYSIEFEPIDITFYFDAPEKVDLNLVEVEEITSHHILRQTELIIPSHTNQSNTETDVLLIQDVNNVTVVPVDVDVSLMMTNNTVLQTYRIEGIVTVNSFGDDISVVASLVNKLVLDAFESKDEKIAYLDLLKLSKDSSIRRIYNVNEGTADSLTSQPTLPDAFGSHTNGDDNDQQGRIMRLAVIVGGSLSAIALLSVVAILLYSSQHKICSLCLCCYRKKNEKTNNSNTESGDQLEQSNSKSVYHESRNTNTYNGKSKVQENVPAKLLATASTKGQQGRLSSKSTSIAIVPVSASNRIMRRPTGGIEGSFRNEKKRTSVPSQRIGISRHQQLEMEAEGDGAIPQAIRTANVDRDTSEISSVYSYLDTQSNFIDMIQDEAYSVGNANIADVDADADDDGHTRNGTWSVNADEQMSMMERTQYNQRSVVDGTKSVSTYCGGSIFGTPTVSIPSFVGMFLSPYGRSNATAQSTSPSNLPVSSNIVTNAKTIESSTKKPSTMVIITKPTRPKPLGEIAATTTSRTSVTEVGGGSNDKDARTTVEVKIIPGGQVELDTESSTSTGSDEQEVIRATVAERGIAAAAVLFGNKYMSRQQNRQAPMLPTSRTDTNRSTGHSNVANNVTVVSATPSSPILNMPRPPTTTRSRFNALSSSKNTVDQYQSDSDIHSIDGDQSLFSSVSKLTHETGSLFGTNGVGATPKSTKNTNYSSDVEDDDQSQHGIAETMMLPEKYNVGVRIIDTGRNRYYPDTDDDLSSTGGSIAANRVNNGQATYGYHGYERNRPFNDMASF